jgi:hypothetical protein
MTLDMLCDVYKLYSDIQIALLVDNATKHILRACTFETSPDGHGWVSSGSITDLRALERYQTTLIGKLACIPVDLAGIVNTPYGVQHFNRPPWI